MSNIYVNVTGNGVGYVDIPNPLPNEVFTIYAYANSPNVLLDITMFDQNGYSIAVYVAPVQQLQYDPNWGDCTINITFSEDTITLNVTGNGQATVSNNFPADGEVITLDCIPDSFKYEVLGVVGTDENGNDIGLIVAQQQTFTYDANWGNITIDVYFDKKFLWKNLWLLCNRQWWRKNNN